MKASDYLVLVLIVVNSMILAALGARVEGFELPPQAVFGLLVVGAPVPVVLAVLPSFGVRVPGVERVPGPGSQVPGDRD